MSATAIESHDMITNLPKMKESSANRSKIFLAVAIFSIAIALALGLTGFVYLFWVMDASFSVSLFIGVLLGFLGWQSVGAIVGAISFGVKFRSPDIPLENEALNPSFSHLNTKSRGGYLRLV